MKVLRGCVFPWGRVGWWGACGGGLKVYVRECVKISEMNSQVELCALRCSSASETFHLEQVCWKRVTKNNLVFLFDYHLKAALVECKQVNSFYSSTFQMLYFYFVLGFFSSYIQNIQLQFK